MNISKTTLGKLHNIFFYTIINPEIRDEIGYKMLSGMDKDQGWYIWLHQLPGVFDMFTLQGEIENSASFLLKYYPSPEEPGFQAYSEQEKKLRNQLLFEKGAPKQDVRENVLADHFIIGQLDVLWEKHLIWLHLIVPETQEGIGGSGIPYLSLSYSLYRHLLRSICFFTKTPPSLILTRKLEPENASPRAAVRQFSCALLPDVEDHEGEIADLCANLGVAGTGLDRKPAGGVPWRPLYIDSAEAQIPASSFLLDEQWWTLPAKAVEVLDPELVV